MLDNSGSMAWDIDGRERYANNSYVNRPMDVVRDDNGDIYVYGLNTRKITVLGSDGSFKRELMGYGPEDAIWLIMVSNSIFMETIFII